MRWWPFARKPVDPTRWVVLDVESSGLDPSRDRLLCVAAVAVQVDWPRRRLALSPGDSFEGYLRQQQPTGGGDILVHGIGLGRQGEGGEPAQVLQDFLQYAGDAPLLGFHVAFDRALLDRCCREVLGERPHARWLDIEPLCAVTHPEQRGRSLDDWLEAFGIRCSARHRAAADALATGELLLRIWPRIAAECGRWEDMERLAARRAWIAGAGQGRRGSL
jgi:DNA polymerase-3 subunit epsilon